jgi:hypothetical protein
MNDHWWNLLEVATKNNCEASKQSVWLVSKVLQTPIKGFDTETILHWSLIPDQKICLAHELCLQ